MEELVCLFDKRPLGSKTRASFCNGKCRSAYFRVKAIAEAEAALALPLATLPPNTSLPPGLAGQATALQMIVQGRAPAGAHGYRFGTTHLGCRSLRWFPSSTYRKVPIFGLDPFELPVVPVAGRYVLIYTDEQGAPIGGFRYTLSLTQVDRRLRFSDGDRSLRTRRSGDR